MALLDATNRTIDTPPVADGAPAVSARAAALNARLSSLPASEILKLAIGELFPGRIALVSSFGAESAVLLHLVANIDPRTPVVFLDTGKLFPETLAYRDVLRQRLGLTDLRNVSPHADALRDEDPDGDLWRRNPDRCCELRKVVPLERALACFDAWIGGRKRFQSDVRASISVVEDDPSGRIQINPLASWSESDIAAYFAENDLPAHPLRALGYRSIGCVPCTDRVGEDEHGRAGRWRGTEKTECGIFNRPKNFVPTDQR
jgi:phosphoadenosine phosphosulfate reductase